MSATPLLTARARIADCLAVENGELLQRRDHLNLAGLDLTDADLAVTFDVPERGLKGISLASLPHLRYLDLTGNQLKELPACVPSFTNLIWLGLNFNQITKLPEFIGALTDLQRLYLRGNRLTELPSGIGNLAALAELDLTGCRIARLPAAMARLEGLDHIALEGKALSPDLQAVWKGKKWKALREHLARTAKELTITQFAGKVVLVGPQENGKTCLQRALRGEKFVKGYKSTDGMSRQRLHLRLDGSFVTHKKRAETPGPREDVIDLTLWDMGGQESYQHTHQMFFTPSAVYLVVTISRQGGGIQELERWIELIKRRTGGEASVIVVSTWCRKFPADKAVTLEELRAKHGETIQAMAEVDSEDGTGIPELRRLLAKVVQEERAKCHHTWLPGWAKVLDELGNSPKAFLRWPQIGNLSAKHGVKDSSEQRQVIRTGHLIGALLWREDIPAGEDVVILNPDWLCRAVARLLDDEETQKAHGLVDIPELGRVWAGKGRDGTPGYKPDTYPALIELMEINELAYRPRVPGKRVGEGNLLLLTQMVEATPPEDVAEKWAAVSPKNATETVRVLRFKKLDSADYEPVPDLVYLLIFRLRGFSLGRNDYRDARHWRRGLLVTDDYGSAGRIELDGTMLRITVRHRLVEGLMHSIVNRIGVRNDDYWNGRGLEQVEFVPCGDICAQGTPDAGLIPMDDCTEAERAGNQSVKCEVCRKFVNIRKLFKQRSVASPEFQELVGILAKNQNDLLAAISSASTASLQAISSLHGLVRQQGDGILDAFTSEWKDAPRLFSLIPIKGKGWNPKTWTRMEFRVTVWCEASRRAVPLFRELKDEKDKSKGFKGSETITLTREWVQGARRALTWGSWATLALATGGAAGIGGLVTATGGIIEPTEAKELAAELARQRGIIKEVATSLPNESKQLLHGGMPAAAADEASGFGEFGSLGFGTPEEGDLKLIRFLREEFKKKDPTWGGLVTRGDGKFGRIWAHPKSDPSAQP